MPSIRIPNAVVDVAIALEPTSRENVESVKKQRDFDEVLAEHWQMRIGDVGRSPTSEHLGVLATSVDLIFQIIALQRTPDDVNCINSVLTLCCRLHKKKFRLTDGFYVLIKDIVVAVDKQHGFGEEGVNDKNPCAKKNEVYFQKD